ncbi:hypothetical protein OIE82_27150 [Streptomyces althioticus]|uniref:Scaffolding protein n=1 Tax=Streptomyces althioticus TaxID=83380 RepID=A0ABZ1YBF0_9ACTN
MSTPVEPTNPPTTPPAAPVEPQKSPEDLIAELTAERDKWKALSRQNEKKWEDTSGELAKLKEAQMTEAEKAIEAARTEGRNSALSEVGTDLVTAEMALQAATAGVTLPPAEYLNVSKFLGDDGRPNKEAVKSFVETLPKAKEEFPNLQGAGKQSGGAPEITTMDPNELADLITGGSIF